MQSFATKKSLIFSILFLIISISFFFFLLEMINQKKEASLLSFEKWETEEEKRRSVESTIHSVEKTSQERAFLESHFIKSSDIVPFLNLLERLSKESGTKSEILSVDVSKDYSSLMVDMKTQGSFESIYKLILLLENSPYDLEFVLVNVQNSVMQTEKISQWSATFKIKLKSFIK